MQIIINLFVNLRNIVILEIINTLEFFNFKFNKYYKYLYFLCYKESNQIFT